MQLAILLVLILIAVILAPWLLGVIAVAAAAVGGSFILLMMIAGVLLPLSFIALWLLRRTTGPKAPEQVFKEKNAAFNKAYLDEAGRRRDLMVKKAPTLHEAEHKASDKDTAGASDDVPADSLTCLNCAATFRRGSLVCPGCGKTPPAN